MSVLRSIRGSRQRHLWTRQGGGLWHSRCGLTADARDLLRGVGDALCGTCGADWQGMGRQGMQRVEPRPVEEP